MTLLCWHCRKSRVEDEDQTINCVALEGGPCFPCREREAIREKIEQLEEEIIKLKEKHRALGGKANEVHDPFIHKFPPEIGSHIFRLCFPTLDFEDFHLWDKAAAFTGVLRLGAVCQKWRQLAWATPSLWDTIYLDFPTWMKVPLVQWLPGLLREWLSRSGMRPLTIFFRYSGCPDEIDDYPPYDEFSDESTVFSLGSAAESVIEIMNLHSGQWRNLHLDVGPYVPRGFCGSMQPNQLRSLELGLDSSSGGSDTPKFVMKSKPFPTQLKLIRFSPTSIDIGWDKITRAILCNLYGDECLEVLRRIPALEYCFASPWSEATGEFGTTIHPHLRSLVTSSRGTTFLDAINVPSLKKWNHNTEGAPLPVAAMLSLLQRSGCCLKRLNLQNILAPPDNLSDLFQAMPSLERLQLSFRSVRNADGVMDDILARIFNSPSSNSTIPSEDAGREYFLPYLQFMGCFTSCGTALFSWIHIPQLYRQGHRRSLTLKSAAEESHISDEIALQLLTLIDEGVDLQILDRTTKGGGDFLENFRKRVSSV